jgi:adenylate kinase
VNLVTGAAQNPQAHASFVLPHIFKLAVSAVEAALVVGATVYVVDLQDGSVRLAAHRAGTTEQRQQFGS